VNAFDGYLVEWRKASAEGQPHWIRQQCWSMTVPRQAVVATIVTYFGYVYSTLAITLMKVLSTV
jgi:hypothetical protein